LALELDKPAISGNMLPVTYRNYPNYHR